MANARYTSPFWWPSLHLLNLACVTIRQTACCAVIRVRALVEAISFSLN